MSPLITAAIAAAFVGAIVFGIMESGCHGALTIGHSLLLAGCR